MQGHAEGIIVIWNSFGFQDVACSSLPFLARLGREAPVLIMKTLGL